MDELGIPELTDLIGHRQRWTGRMIAVAGGLGKTTTQRMIEAVLSGRFSGRSLGASANGRSDLPLALLQLQPARRVRLARIPRRQERTRIRRFRTCANPKLALLTASLKT